MAARLKLPAMFSWREFTDAGGLMSYGSNLPDPYRTAARLVEPRALMYKGCYSVEVANVADLDTLYGHTNGPRRDRQSRKLDAVRWIVGIEQDTDAREVRYRELEKIEPLTNKCVVDEIPCSGYIAARSCSALRIPCCNRIFGKDHDDRNCPRYGVRGQSTGRRAGDNDVRIERHQLARKWEHALGRSVSIADRQGHIPSFDISKVAQRADRNAVTLRLADAAESGDSMPISGRTGIAACCARAASGHAAAPPSSVMNSRRRIIRSPRRHG